MSHPLFKALIADYVALLDAEIVAADGALYRGIEAASAWVSEKYGEDIPEEIEEWMNDLLDAQDCIAEACMIVDMYGAKKAANRH